MKLISLWEPWATLVSIGAKRIETRSWQTPYRGWLAIHSAKHFTAEEDSLCWTSPFREALQHAGIPVAPYRSGKRFQFPLGHIVAVVRLEECCPMEDAGCLPGVFSLYPELDTQQEQAFGNYDPGRWAWVTSDLFRLPEPIPFKSKQGLVDVPYDIMMQMDRQQRNGNKK